MTAAAKNAVTHQMGQMCPVLQVTQQEINPWYRLQALCGIPQCFAHFNKTLTATFLPQDTKRR